MKWLLTTLLLSFTGCTCGIDYVKDAADTVNREAFDGKIVYSIMFKAEPGIAASWTPLSQQIRLHPDWVWQPWIFVEGVIAHEMIHASFDERCPGDDVVDDDDAAEAGSLKTMHGPAFMKSRREVAEKLGIPRWAIPTGRKGTRLDMYWTCRYLEGVIQAAQMQVRGQRGFVIVPQ